MKYQFTFLCLFAFCFVSKPLYAQNILLNGDFEFYSSCPVSISQLTLATDWQELVLSADYYNCGLSTNPYLSNSLAYSGTGFVGFASYGISNGAAEAIGQNLPQPLLPSNTYQFLVAAKKTSGGIYSSNCGGVALYGYENALPASAAGIHLSQNPSAMLLGITAMVQNTNWQIFSFTFSPTDTINYIGLTVENTPNCQQCIFIDSASISNTIYTITAGIAADSILCAGDSATITVTATNGSGALQYSLNGSGFQATNVFTVAAGTYFAIVKDSLNTIDTTNTLTITSPTAINGNISANPINCFGNQTLLSVAATGGTSPYQYSLNGGTFQNNNNFNIDTGTYTVVIKDTNNCTFTTNTLTLTQPNQLTATASASTPLCSYSTSSLTVTANGGTSPYQYALNGGVFQNSNTFIISNTGIYTITVKDANNCTTIIDSINISFPLPIVVTTNYNPIPCYNGTTDLTITAIGGTGTFQYSLNGGAFQNSNVFNVGQGTYTVTVQDGNNCTFSTNPFSISAPNVFAAIASASAILCHDGNTTLNVTATGGTSPYLYSLNGAASQSSNAFVVNAGTFIVTVQDANGCLTTSEKVIISNPPAINLILKTGVLCYNSTTTLTAASTGGTGTKQYSFDGNVYQIDNHFTVGAGTHNVTIKDINNCTATASIDIIASLPISIEITLIDSVYCNGANGQATVSATGGNDGLTYTWITNPRQYGDHLQEVAEGIYTVQVKDAKGCKNEMSLYMPAIPSPIANYISRPDNDFHFIYNGDEIQFFPNTTGIYSYYWDFGDGMFSTEPQPFHTFAQSGDYIVTLTAYDKHKACPDTYTLPYSIASTCASLFIPDAFSPNGDGLNDVFAFVGNPAAFEATIYDRWGKIITQFSAIQDTWDGKNAPEGVYTYKLKLICENGKALSRAGTITLLR